MKAAWWAAMVCVAVVWPGVAKPVRIVPASAPASATPVAPDSTRAVPASTPAPAPAALPTEASAAAPVVPPAAAPAARPDSTDINLRECLKKGGYSQVLLTRTEAGVWTAVATLGSLGATVLVDPKAPYTFMDGAALRKLGYSPAATKRVISFGGASEPLYRIAFGNFALGEMNADSVPFDVVKLDPVLRASGLDPSATVAGIIGADFLRRSDALIDMENDRLFIHRPRPAPVDSAEAKAAAAKGTKEPLLGDLERRLRKREKQETP